MRTTVGALIALAAIATIGTAVTIATADGHQGTTTRHTTGRLDPADFTHPKSNPYFPLRPGTTTVLRGTDEGEHLVDRVRVTHKTKLILGIHARVLSDVLHRSDGSLAEKTTDWYAADNHGNVWYLGEDTATYDEQGHLESREGSWQAGVHGAKAGLIMPAQPKATDAYRQELLRGQAEDQAWIVGNDEKATVPLGTFHHVVRSYEWTRLEPGVISLKLYAPGVGIAREQDVAGGNETFKVVSISHD